MHLHAKKIDGKRPAAGSPKTPVIAGTLSIKAPVAPLKVVPTRLDRVWGVTIQSGQVSRTKDRNTPGLINQAPSPRPRALAGNDPPDLEPPLARASPPRPAASL